MASRDVAGRGRHAGPMLPVIGLSNQMFHLASNLEALSQHLHLHRSGRGSPVTPKNDCSATIAVPHKGRKQTGPQGEWKPSYHSSESATVPSALSLEIPATPASDIRALPTNQRTQLTLEHQRPATSRYLPLLLSS